MFAVLWKVVPDLDQLRFDPQRKTVIRDGAQLYANPFDQRALRVALDLRRPGESVVVLSMGPPSAGAALREGLALGADRALLVTDPLLAGSDTLVTARTLARALSRVDHRVVLTGMWTTDSETGQVPPQIAGLLGVPVVTAVQAIRRDSDGPGFELTSDTPHGWARRRLAAPCVVAVGEKIAKLKRPTPSEVAAVAPERVERLTVGDLGLHPDQVGLAASPTVVESIENVAPERHPLLLDSGTVAERVAKAIARLQEVLSAAPSVVPPLPPRGGPLSESDEVLLLVTNSEGSLEEAVLPIVAGVRRHLPPLWPSAVWIGPPPPAGACRALSEAGALRLRTVETSAPVGARTGALAFEATLRASARSAAVAFLADSFGREVAGQVAARNGLGLTGDAVEFHLGTDGEVRWRKPAFGGGILADIRSRSRPSLATVRPGVLEGGAAPDSSPLAPERLSATLPEEAVQELDSGREPEGPWGDLDAARVVVTVGMGLGGPERLWEIAPLLERTGAALAATRRVVDAGWVPRRLQVGLTGRSLAPELVVLLGVSGAVNHLIGWKRARAILAVNVDPKAPVLRAVDVAIVGRWEEYVGPLSDALAPLARRP